MNPAPPATQYSIPGVGLVTDPTKYGYTTANAPVYNPGQTTPNINPSTAGLTPYTGTGAFVTVNGQNYNAPGQATPPTNASQISQGGGTIIPQLTPSFGNTANAAASADGAQKQVDLSIQSQTDAANAAKAQADQLSAQNTQAKGYLTSLINANPAQTARANAENQTGINPTDYFANQQALITQIGSLQTDYNNTKAAMDSAVQAAQANAGGQLSGAVNDTVAKIQQTYSTQLSQKSANINAQAAVLQALQGNFASAQSFVTQAVNDATADQKYQVDLLQTFIQQNDTEISRLDTTYQNSLALAQKTAQDTLTTARNAANDYYDNQLKAAQTASLTTSNASGVKLTPTQLNQGASSLGVTTADYQKLDPQVQTFFTAPGGKSFLSAIDDIKNGKNGPDGSPATYDSVKNSIDSSVQPQAVKDYMLQLLNQEVPQGSNNSFLGKLGNWFSGKGFQ